MASSVNSLESASLEGEASLLPPFFILKILFYIGVRLMDNVVLILGAQQSDSVLHTHLSTLFQVPFPFRLFKTIE